MTNTPGPPALLCEGVSHTYRLGRRQAPIKALDDVSMTIQASESVAILGPNGSGKSTLFHLICGSRALQQGSIRVFGEGAPGERRKQIGAVMQSASLDPHLTVIENLRFQATLYGLHGQATRHSIDESLAKFGLEEKRLVRVKTLSGGLARRLDLCRALLHHPPFLLLDEPTTGLDPAARDQFLNEVFRRNQSEGLTILLNTHLTDEADRCSRVIIMHQGRVVGDDAPDALKRRVGSRLLSVAGTSELPRSADTLAWNRVNNSWQTPLPEGTDSMNVLLNDLIESGRSMTIAPPSLADVFVSLTGDSLTTPDKNAELQQAAR